MTQLALDEMEEGEICEEVVAMETGTPPIYHSKAFKGIHVHRIGNENLDK